MEEYEALVRDQLSALGYNSDAIPDEVLREFLREFESKANIGSAAVSSCSPLPVHPDDEAPPWINAEEDSSHGAKPAAPLDGEQLPPPSTAPCGRKGSGARTPGSALRSAANHPPPMAASRLKNASSASALSPRPSSAPQKRAPAHSPRAASSGVIWSESGSGMFGSVRKSDPVSMHAMREKQWRSDSFLSASPRRHTPAPCPIAVRTSVSATRVRSRTLKSNTYVVPTTKRRDALVWETRLRMREAQVRGTTPRPQKAMVPNSFVPPTDKPRHDLRWQVRSDMAMRA